MPALVWFPDPSAFSFGGGGRGKGLVNNPTLARIHGISLRAVINYV